LRHNFESINSAQPIPASGPCLSYLSAPVVHLAFSSALGNRAFLHGDDCSVDTSSAAFARSFENFKCSTPRLQKQRVS
jgi:hypothetical protein